MHSFEGMKMMKIKGLNKECGIVKCDEDRENGEKVALSPRRLVNIHLGDEETKLVNHKGCGSRWWRAHTFRRPNGE